VHIKNVGWFQRRCIWLAVNAPIKTALLSVRALGSESGRRDAAAAFSDPKEWIRARPGPGARPCVSENTPSHWLFLLRIFDRPRKILTPALVRLLFSGEIRRDVRQQTLSQERREKNVVQLLSLGPVLSLGPGWDLSLAHKCDRFFFIRFTIAPSRLLWRPRLASCDHTSCMALHACRSSPNSRHGRLAVVA
jgi:hypothetical protein